MITVILNSVSMSIILSNRLNSYQMIGFHIFPTTKYIELELLRELIYRYLLMRLYKILNG